MSRTDLAENDVAAKPRLTRGTLFVVAAMNLVDCMNMNLLTPYAAKMVSTFEHRQPDDEAVLHQVGVLIGLYNISEMVFSPLWGWLSDRIGRRAVLLMGLAGTPVMAILFGLSTSLPTAMLFRALAGVMCGNVGVTKTYLAELVDETNEARAFGMLATMYSLGMFVGPLVGGLTIFPADWAPGLFQDTLFEEKPFLMPSVCFAAFCAVVWLLAACCLEETLPRMERQGFAAGGAARRSLRSAKAASTKSEEKGGQREETGTAACCRFSACLPFGRAPPSELVRMVLAYGLVVGYIIATTQTFVLIVQISPSQGGFGLSPTEVALLQNCAAGGLMLTQLLLYPWLVQTKGYRFCITLGLLAVMAVTFPFPLYGLMADPGAFGVWRLVPLGCMMLVQQAAFGLCTPTCTVWVNRFAKGMDRGTINGLTNSFAALCRALAPELGSTLLGLGLSSSLPLGRYLPIYATGLLGVAILLLARPVLPQLPPAPPAKAAFDEEQPELPVRRLARAGTWWHDEGADVLDLDEDPDAGRSLRRSTWWAGQDAAVVPATSAGRDRCQTA